MSVWKPVPVLPMPPQLAAELDQQRELDEAFGPVVAYWPNRDPALPVLLIALPWPSRP